MNSLPRKRRKEKEKEREREQRGDMDVGGGGTVVERAGEGAGIDRGLSGDWWRWGNDVRVTSTPVRSGEWRGEGEQ